MKTREWTDEEIEYLRLGYMDKTLCEMGSHIGVAPSTVRNKLHEMGLRAVHKTRRPREWSEDEIRYLREKFPSDSAGDIAYELGVSAPLVMCKARELGLRKNPGWAKRSYYRRYVNSYSGAR